jgi:phosphate/sulfate permease
MSSIKEIAAALVRTPSAEHRLRKQILGVGIASGFFLALVGYSLTGSGWWFVSPFVGAAIAWRFVFGRWPFSGHGGH